ncbi:MAG: hypothetical protein ACI9YH_000276 [Colwellia sp.]|jgi:hypothetical protein
MSSSVKKIAIKSTKLIALIFITLFTLIWLLSPYVSHHFASKYLNEQQLTLSDETTISYNPFGSILTIRDLAVSETKNIEKSVLAIKSMDVKVSLYRLLTDTLHFSEFTIDGLYLDVNLNEVDPVIGGFVIASNSNGPATIEASKENAKEVEKNDTDSEQNNYQVSLPNFNLSDAVFNIGIEQSQQEFAIDSLTIKNVLASTQAQQAEIYLKAFINKAPLNVNVEALLENNQGKISSELELSKLALAPFQPILLALGEEKNPLTLAGSVSINSEQVISITDLGTKISLETFELITDGLKASQENKTLALNIAPFSIKDLTVELYNEQAPAIKGTAKLNVHDIIAYDGKESQILANISAINLDEISITTKDSLIKANIPSLTIKQSVFAENTTDEHQPLATFQNLSLNDISVSQQGLFIDTITLLGLAVNAKLDENKNMVGLPVSTKDNPTIEEPVEEKTSQQNDSEDKIDSAEPSFTLAINSFSFTDTSHINFTDQSITPHYERDFEITTFSAGPFDNQKPQQESHISLKGGSNKYASFDLSAVAKPFSKQDFYQLKGFLKEVSLPSLSTYISEALKHELKAGQLDVDLDVAVDNTDIDGNVVLLLRGVELGAANDHEADTIKSQTAMPLNIAIGMLKGSDGNVELDIPLDGDTSDPSFGMRGFISLMIKQATMSAAKDYLMTTFVPYANVVSVAMSAGDYLLKVRFNDLAFPVKETELTDEHSAFLTQFAALMTDKPDTQLTLCAISTPEDINKPLGVEITDKSEIKKLADFSENRLETFKEYMVKDKGIASSRLLLCSPKIDSSIGAQPRITFTD